MPDISALGSSLLGPFANSTQTGQLGSALGNFQNVLQTALGDQAVGQIQDAMANPPTTLQPTTEVTPPSFGGPSGQVEALTEATRTAVTNRLEQVESSSAEAQAKVQEMLSGGDVDLHNVILASERAKLELQLTMQLRNKLIEAYQEVMRTPV